MPRRREEVLSAGEVPGAFSDPGNGTWKTVDATEAWLRRQGISLTPVAVRLLPVGPATRLLMSMSAWRSHVGFAGRWPHRYPSLFQQSLQERLHEVGMSKREKE